MKLYDQIFKAIERIGAIVLVIIAFVFAVDVIGRYIFGLTASWIVDLEWYLASIAILLSFAPTLRVDGHVRVDVLRGKMSPRSKIWIDRIGHFFLLLPWCLFMVYASSRYAYNSFLIGEGSPDPGGLPLRWLIKSFLPIGFSLLLVEGLRQIFSKKERS